VNVYTVTLALIQNKLTWPVYPEEYLL